MLGKLETSATARGCQEVFAYWSSLRATGRLPCRAQIDPVALKRLLPTISLIDVQRLPAGRGYRQRLAGTGLYPVYGREITGRLIEEIYSEAELGYWREQLDQVVETARPAVGCQSVTTPSGAASSVLWIRLPLASDGERVDMILGYDAVIGAPVSRMPSGIRAA
jgi:hypothetical protein